MIELTSSRRRLAVLAAIAAAASCARSPVATSPAAPLPTVPTAGSGAPLPFKLAPRATSAAITPADLMTRVYIFADDSMMGREVGTIYNDKGTAYIERELRRIGLRPGGENGTFFQAIALAEHTFGTSSELSVDGFRLVPNTDFIARDNRAFGPTIAVRSVDGAQAVFGGVFNPAAPNPAATLLDPLAAIGKFVVIAVASDAAGQPQWMGSRGGLSGFYQRSAGVAVVALDAIDAATRQQLFTPEMVFSTQSRDTIPTFMYVSRAAAEQLLGAPVAGLAAGAAGKTVRGRMVFDAKSMASRNVIGILEGSDPALRRQYVAIGAHNDHVGFNDEPVDHDSLRAFNTVVRPGGADSPERAATASEVTRIRLMVDSMRRLRPARADSIFNGADDDASGSMALLEIAEMLAASPVKPKRSILFIWHTGEEAGLWGSDFFTERPTVPRDSIVAQLNVDMVGRGGAADAADGGPGYIQLIGSRRLSTELGDIVENSARSQPVPFRIDYAYDADRHPQQYYCRSDHYNYARFGIPVAFFSTGGHRDYHQVTDEPQYLDYAKLARVTTLIKDVAVTVADLGHRVVVDKPKPNPYAPCVQ